MLFGINAHGTQIEEELNKYDIQSLEDYIDKENDYYTDSESFFDTVLMLWINK